MEPMESEWKLSPSTNKLQLLCINGSTCKMEVLQTFELFVKSTDLNFDAIVFINEGKEETLMEPQSVSSFLEFHVKKPVISVCGDSSIYTKPVKIDEDLLILGLDRKKGKEGYEDFVVTLSAHEKTTDFIWLAHSLPIILEKDKTKAEADSELFSALIKKFHENVLCIIHGQPNGAAAARRLEGTKVDAVYPGDFSTGKFSIVSLIKGESDKWKLQSTKFYNLNYLI